MNRDMIAKKLQTIMEQDLNVSLREPINESDRLFEDLQIDSLMVLQLAVYIEERFQVTVPEEAVDPAAFRTVGSLVSFVHNLAS